MMQPYGHSGTRAGLAFAGCPRFELTEDQFGRLVEHVAPLGAIVKLRPPRQEKSRQFVESYGHISGFWFYLAKNADAAAVKSVLRSYAA
jgi:hypothetical protein